MNDKPDEAEDRSEYRVSFVIEKIGDGINEKTMFSMEIVGPDVDELVNVMNNHVDTFHRDDHVTALFPESSPEEDDVDVSTVRDAPTFSLDTSVLSKVVEQAKEHFTKHPLLPLFPSLSTNRPSLTEVRRISHGPIRDEDGTVTEQDRIVAGQEADVTKSAD